MNKEKFCFSSDVVELSEVEDRSYLQMVNRVCYYGAPNINNVTLPADTAADYAQTLVDMPVYAKCRVNDEGEPTFGSHEVHLDADGDLFFDTIPIGVHTSVEVKDDTVSVNGTEKTLPCLFATQKIWTRNKHAVAAIKRLFSEGKLHNSWELCSNAYTFDNGMKTITDYEFVGNTMLGYEYADPAYGESAEVLSISQKDQLMVAEALSRDLIENKEQEDGNLDPNMNMEPEQLDPVVSAAGEPEGETAPAEPVVPAEPQPAEPEVAPEGDPAPAAEPEGEPAGDPDPAPAAEPVVSALTAYDIHEKVREAARALLDCWCWVAFLFPQEHYALLKTEKDNDELEYTQVSYAVGEDDTVTVSDPRKIKLAVSVSEINAKLDELNETIADLNDKLTKAETEISALEPYREAAEKAEHDRQKEELLSYARNSGLFTEEELAGEELYELIENIDTSAIKAQIADRVVAKQHKPEVAQAAPISNASIAEAADKSFDPRAIMRDFLSNH